MEQTTTNTSEIELASLVLRYAHTRIPKPKQLRMLSGSMERYGQITPVMCVLEGTHPVLIDGYLRVEALKLMGKDTLKASVWESDEREALLQLLGRTQERQWEALEQAWIIRELSGRFGYTQREIARSIGHDTSWVSRRISLLETLPEDILAYVCSGRVSVSAATRVLVPLARGNAPHARKLCDHLQENPMPTRDIGEFFKHYQKSNRKTRQRMIEDPNLFIKALKSKDEKALDTALNAGPEGEWLKDFEIVQAVLKRAMKRMDIVIYPGQDQEDRDRLVRAFEHTRLLVTCIGEKIAKVEP
jgi:ParB family transcriptional regulator, chromosome partitioning protein